MKTKIADILIDKELEIVGALAISKDELATHKTILEDTKLGLFGKEDWFTYYTFMTVDQYDEWQDFCHELIKKSNPKWNTRKISEEFKMFDLFFGLKHDYIKSPL
jgi:hypothetical protein